MVEDKLFFPVPGVITHDLLNWQDADERKHRVLIHRNKKNKLRQISEFNLENSLVHKKCFGHKVKINDVQIALFRFGDEIYAVQAKCPHAGGPLYLADIEELNTGQLCLKCPSHKWTFDINTGQCIIPGDRGVIAKTYPVKVNREGGISIGFDSFGPSAFMMDN